MEIPYTKVLIYSLTFLVYAYSGYGAGLLENLRDAVLNAENIFGNVARNIATWATRMKHINSVFDAAVDEDCIYKCPNGAPPRRRKGHRPSANGCGSLGVQINMEYLPVKEMKECCDAHDICYDTCNRDKEGCDRPFQRCLYGLCEKYEYSIGEGMVKACKGAAKLLFTGTQSLGCKAYLNAQEKACHCPAPYGWKNENKDKKYPGADEL